MLNPSKASAIETIILIRPRQVPVEDEPLARDGEGVGHGLLVADAVEAAVDLGQVVELDIVLVVGRADLKPWAEPCHRRDIGHRLGHVESGTRAARPTARHPRTSRRRRLRSETAAASDWRSRVES